MRHRSEGLFVALGSFVWFALQTPWGLFPDPDAFYHAHVTRLMLEQGPLHSFPWLDLTTFGQHFVDHHFLFHALTVPVVWIMDRVAPGPFAEFWAAQGMALLLATATTFVLWRVLKHLDPSRAWLWTVLTLLVPAFTMRMLLAKASPVAVGLFIAIIGLFVWSDVRLKKKSVLLFFAGLLFALSHGGWIIALLGAGSIFCADLLFRKLGEDRSWNETIRSAPWMECFSLVAGIVAGLFLHPNRSELIAFLWVQVFKAAIAPPTHIIQGGEWKPASAGFIAWELAPLLIAGLVAILILVLSKRRIQITTASFRRIVLLAFPVALTLALTLNGRRFLEYLVPMVALWIASVWSLIDAGMAREAIDRVRSTWPRIIRRSSPTIALVLAITLAVHHAWAASASLHRDGAKSFEGYQRALASISSRAAPGDRVFHSDWDEFPVLFAADDRLKYVSGLDPVFLADANPQLSNAIVDLTLGRATSTAFEIIAQQTHSRFVFVTYQRHPIFDATLRENAQFKELFRDSETSVYSVDSWAQ